MLRCPDRLSVWLATRSYPLPPCLWFLIASPLLCWAGIGDKWFVWPRGARGWWRWSR